jgi:hypothetical protein
LDRINRINTIKLSSIHPVNPVNPVHKRYVTELLNWSAKGGFVAAFDHLSEGV